MTSISESFVGIIDRILGTPSVETAKAAAKRPWISRGVANAVARLRIASADETELAAVWSFAFEAGAQDAIRFARIVLSDPAVKGLELEALTLVGEGLGHAAVLAALRASKPNNAGIQTDREATVVAFPKNRSRGADADRKKGE